VSKLLSPFYWVEKLRETTVHKDDLRQCEVHAWTERPGAIPPSRLLRIAEKEIPVVHSDPDVQRIFGNLTPNLRKKRTLIYNVDFHLRRIADFRPRTPSTSSDSLSGDGDSGPDGNPERHYGFRQGHAGLDSPPFPGGTSARRDAAAPPALPQGLRVAPRGTRLLALLPARHKRAPLCYGTSQSGFRHARRGTRLRKGDRAATSCPVRDCMRGLDGHFSSNSTMAWTPHVPLCPPQPGSDAA
jgi:hypothetical protein